MLSRIKSFFVGIYQTVIHTVVALWLIAKMIVLGCWAIVKGAVVATLTQVLKSFDEMDKQSAVLSATIEKMFKETFGKKE